MSGSAQKLTFQIFYIVALALKTKGFLGGIERSDLPPKSCEFTKSPRKDSLCAPRVAAETVLHFLKVMRNLCAPRVVEKR